MAMAYLRPQGRDRDADAIRFLLDIGGNRYYTYRIGSGEVAERDGFAELAAPSYVAPLVGPLAPQQLGRAVLAVPAARFDRDNDHIQLVSYRQLPDIGPAVSDILKVGTAADADRRPHRREAVMTITQPDVRLGSSVHAFAYQESEFSEAAFLESILPVLQQVLPVVSQAAPLIGQLVGSGGTEKPTAPAGGAADQSPLQQLLTLIQQLLAGKGAGQPSPAASATQQSVFTAASAAVRALDAAATDAHGAEYAEASAVPALLALAPLIQKALNPETIKAISALDPGVQAQQNLQAIRDHLAKIMPSADTSAIYQLLALLAAQQSSGSLVAVMPEFEVAPGAALAFDPDTTQPGVSLRGAARRLYRTDRACSFPLVVNTPRGITGGRLHWQVRLATGANALIDEERPVETITASGPVPVTPVLTAQQLSGLAAGEEHVLCAFLLWRTRSGRTLGLTAMLPFIPVDRYVYDRVAGDATPETALDNVDTHRPFWQKVWQATLTDEVFRYEYETKYYYALDTVAERTARGVTRIQDEPRDLHTQTGRMEASMQLALVDLNQLLPQAGGVAPLDDARLAALRNRDFACRFDTAARYKARYGGRRGTSVALWVFPAVGLSTVVLQRCDDVDPYGRVTRLSEETVRFPVPVAAHFVGVTTDT